MFIFVLGTHSVIAVNISTTSENDITCVFNVASHAIGCFINLTNMASGITYCIALQRFSNLSGNRFPVFQSCNKTYVAGRYLLKLYDVEKDGNISELPAVIQEVVLGISDTMIQESTLSGIKSSSIIICECIFSLCKVQYHLLHLMMQVRFHEPLLI